MVRTKLVPKRIRQWLPKQPYTKCKIKTLLPEQNTINIKKTDRQLEAQLLEEKLKNLQINGRETFKMLAPNWQDHDLETNPIINHFADRNNTELILKKVEDKIKKQCFYCRECKNCKRFNKYLKVFKKNSFWTFNKNVKVWNVYNPLWCKKYLYLKLEEPNQYVSYLQGNKILNY